jgi:hypothetical protein
MSQLFLPLIKFQMLVNIIFKKNIATIHLSRSLSILFKKYTKTSLKIKRVITRYMIKWEILFNKIILQTEMESLKGTHTKQPNFQTLYRIHSKVRTHTHKSKKTAISKQQKAEDQRKIFSRSQLK